MAVPPFLGFLSEGRGPSLRPVLGFPGAARIGNALAIPGSVARLDIAPGHAYAVVALRPDDTVGLLLLSEPNTTPYISSLPVSLKAADVVTFSPVGSSAAIWSPTERSVHVITGLPLSPVEVLSSTLPTARPRLFAVSDDGQRLLFADGENTLYSLRIGSTPELVSSNATVSAIQFVPNLHDAIVGESTTGSVMWIRETSGPAAICTITSHIDGMAEPRVLGVSMDGRTAFVADGQHNRVWVVNLETNAITGYDTPAMVQGFSRSRNLDTFIAFSTGEIVSVLSWDGEELTSTVVPSGAPRGVSRGHRQ